MANPRGFCAGVRRAIDIVNRAVKIFKEPIYVNHELVHNSYVIKEFRKKGVKFVEDINEIPDGSVLIFSAHGVSKKIKETAKARNFKIFDATCPLVSRVHSKVSRASRDCSEVILIGHSGHPEVKGTMGQYTNKFGKIYLVESEKDAFLLKVKNPNNLIFVTQTTLSIIDTKKIIEILYYRFPNISSLGKNDICYATTNRQESLNKLAKIVEVILVIGSENSSNSNRLVESVHFMNKPVYLVDSAKDVKKEWIRNIDRVGITAGASAPGILVDQVIEKLRLWSIKKFSVEEIHGKFENIFFKIPENLI